MASVAIRNITKIKLEKFCERKQRRQIDVVSDAVEKYMRENK